MMLEGSEEFNDDAQPFRGALECKFRRIWVVFVGQRVDR